MFHLGFRPYIQKILAFTLVFCLFFNNASAFAAPNLSRSEILPGCEDINELTLRVDLNRIFQGTFASETNFDVAEIVNQQWNILNLDSVIDTEVSNAVNSIRSDAGLLEKFKSNWSSSQVDELTTSITYTAFNSPTLKSRLTQLSDNIAQVSSAKLELASANSLSSTIDCLQRFIGSQYSQTFVDIFDKNVAVSHTNTGDILNSINFSTAQLINQHKSGIIGGTLLIASTLASKTIANEIFSRIIPQLGARILGEQLSSNWIPVAGQFIGGAMLVKDLVDSLDGALPEIEKALQSPEVKQSIKQEIITTVDEELRTQSFQIARDISADIYAEWLVFQKDYQETLSLAGELPEFKKVLKQANEFSKVSSLVGISLNNMGRSKLVEYIQDGTFKRALFLPESSYQIIRTSHDLSTPIAWVNLAGSQIDGVVEYELYKHLSPQDLNRGILSDLLSLNDSATIAKLMLLDMTSVRELLGISQENLVALGAKLSAEDLEKLAGYLKGLQQYKVNQLVKFILNGNYLAIQDSTVMVSLIQSNNLNAAIKFWEAKRSLNSFISGTFQTLVGEISWRLVIHKYGIIRSGLLLLGIPLLLIFILWLFLWLFNKTLTSQISQILSPISQILNLGASNAD